MDSQTKVNVDFKPAKRMKKRRELDALVNGKQPPSFRTNGRMVRNGKHELLRNDSDSSEVEEFILPEKSLVRKRGHSSFCSVCVTVCWGFLLVICLIGIGALVWMCIQLKRDVDQLRAQVDKVGMLNSNTPGELHEILIQQESFNGRISQLETGENGVEKLRENITLLMKQLLELNTTTKSLSQLVANTPQFQHILTLPQQVKDLSKNVAELGSNLQTMEQNVGQLQEAQTKAEHQLNDIDARLQSVQLASEPKIVGGKDSITNQDPSTKDMTKLDSVLKDLILLNTTFYTQIDDLKTQYSKQQVSILDLFNYTTLLNTRVTFLEVRPQSPTQSEIMLTVTATVQSVLEGWRNASADQQKAQPDSVITLLQAQIMNHEKRISSVLENLNKLNVSLSDLENATDLSMEMLRSKVWSLSEKLKDDLMPNTKGATFLPPTVNSTSGAGQLPITSTPSSSFSTIFLSAEAGSSMPDGGNQKNTNNLTANGTSLN